MFCQKCGAEIPEGKKFCADCGTPVTAKEKNSKFVLIIVACIALIAIVCAIFFGIKLMDGKDPEPTTSSTSTTAEITTAPTTTLTTTSASTTTATTAKINAAKPNTRDFIIGKEYEKVPINIKTKKFYNATWRGYIQECEDAEFKVFYDKNYKLKSMSAYYHKPSLKGSLIKHLDLTYSSKGEAVITVTNYLGFTGNYTEEDFIENFGAVGVETLEGARLACSDGLFINPLAKFDELRPDLTAGMSGYIYRGKETLKTGEAYKFEVDSPKTGETLFIWMDKRTGAMAKMTILYRGTETLYFEASEITVY